MGTLFDRFASIPSAYQSTNIISTAILRENLSIKCLDTDCLSKIMYPLGQILNYVVSIGVLICAPVRLESTGHDWDHWPLHCSYQLLPMGLTLFCILLTADSSLGPTQWTFWNNGAATSYSKYQSSLPRLLLLHPNTLYLMDPYPVRPPSWMYR